MYAIEIHNLLKITKILLKTGKYFNVFVKNKKEFITLLLIQVESLLLWNFKYNPIDKNLSFFFFNNIPIFFLNI